MISIFSALILGIVEGFTEFLPISSTGHLIVVADLLQIDDPAGLFEIVIQGGAVLAVLWYYRADLWQRLRTAGLPENRGFWRNLLVAFLPAAVLGFLLGDIITSVLFSPLVVAISLIVGGIILWLVDHKPRTEIKTNQSLNTITFSQALWIGIAQIAALIPGVSRSGSSIVGGLLVGVSREIATTFSFYLAIPTLGGATLYKLIKDGSQLSSENTLALIVATATAFVTALIAIKWLIAYVAKNDFRTIAIYRIVLGIVVLAWALSR